MIRLRRSHGWGTRWAILSVGPIHFHFARNMEGGWSFFYTIGFQRKCDDMYRASIRIDLMR